jgi:hypothetical protein
MAMKSIAYIFGLFALLSEPFIVGHVEASDLCVRDIRADVLKESIAYRIEHPVETYEAPKRLLQKADAKVASLSGFEVPGGVGYGYWFKDNDLLWNDSTVLDYFIITPSTVGGNMDYYLYLTSANRSNLGTEAFISYYKQNEATFKVYDWARADHWQVSLNLPTDHPEYLTVAPDEVGNTRQCCRIRNGTRYLGSASGKYEWRNEVFLFNFNIATWDLVYSYDYTTVSKTDNTYQSGEHYGSWGPIVEIWTDKGSYSNLNQIGFAHARLFQDGSGPRWLTDTNSYQDSMAFFREISRSYNRGFVVYTGLPDSDGDGQDDAQEVLGDTDPYLMSSVFKITAIDTCAPSNWVSIKMPSAIGRQYDVYAAETVTGPWSNVSSVAVGSTTQLTFRISGNADARFFRAAASYDSGILCVAVNANAASFSLAPASGIVPAYWTSRPEDALWERIVVGIPEGTYTITYDDVQGLTTPSSCAITLTNGSVTHVDGIYLPR